LEWRFPKKPCSYHENREENPEVPHVFVQWKGSNVCLDLTCPVCGTSAHYCGNFAYFLECPVCGRLWELSWYIEVRDGSDVPEEERTQSLLPLPNTIRRRGQA
jgi:hypothetical protein